MKRLLSLLMVLALALGSMLVSVSATEVVPRPDPSTVAKPWGFDCFTRMPTMPTSSGGSFIYEKVSDKSLATDVTVTDVNNNIYNSAENDRYVKVATTSAAVWKVDFADYINTCTIQMTVWSGESKITASNNADFSGSIVSDVTLDGLDYSNPNNFDTMSIDISPLLQNNPNKTIYLKFENTGTTNPTNLCRGMYYTYTATAVTPRPEPSTVAKPWSFDCFTRVPTMPTSSGGSFLYEKVSDKSQPTDVIVTDVNNNIYNSAANDKYVKVTTTTPAAWKLDFDDNINTCTIQMAVWSGKSKITASNNADFSGSIVSDMTLDGLNYSDPTNFDTMSIDISPLLQNNPNKTIYLKFENIDIGTTNPINRCRGMYYTYEKSVNTVSDISVSNNYVAPIDDNSTATGTTSSETTPPKTGDNSRIYLTIILLMVSASAGVVLAFLQKSRRFKE